MNLKGIEAISDETIAENNYTLGELWMVKHSDGIAGPFHTDQLKSLTDSEDAELESWEVYNLESENWQNFFKCPQFQRRVPQLVPLMGLSTSDEFMVLSHGKKTGPFTLEQLEEKLAASEVLLNDLITSNEAEGWIKIHEHHFFDRRQKTDTLPFGPREEIFGRDDDNVIGLHKKDSGRDEEEAMVGLAFLALGNDHGQMIHAKHPEKPAAKKNIEENSAETNNVTIGKFETYQERESSFRRLIKNQTAQYSAAAVVVLLFFFTVMNSFNNRFDNEYDIKFAGNRNHTDISVGEKAERKPSAAKQARNLVKNKELRPKKNVIKKRQVPIREKKVAHKPTPAPTPAPKKRGPDHSDNPYADDYANDYPYDDEPIVHYDDEVNIDINDPQVRDEISRELASEMDNGEMTPEQKNALQQKIRNEIDSEAEQYLEEQGENYEQVSDFE